LPDYGTVFSLFSIEKERKSRRLPKNICTYFGTRYNECLPVPELTGKGRNVAKNPFKEIYFLNIYKLMAIHISLINEGKLYKTNNLSSSKF